MSREAFSVHRFYVVNSKSVMNNLDEGLTSFLSERQKKQTF